jgi:hypothetical protein
MDAFRNRYSTHLLENRGGAACCQSEYEARLRRTLAEKLMTAAKVKIKTQRDFWVIVPPNGEFLIAGGYLRISADSGISSPRGFRIHEE